MYRIGVDIGGMSIKTGIVDEKGVIVLKTVTKTAKDTDEVLNNMKNDAFKLLKETGISVKEVMGIGVGCPGSIDSEKGKVIYSNNIGWKNFAIRDGL